MMATCAQSPTVDCRLVLPRHWTSIFVWLAGGPDDPKTGDAKRPFFAHGSSVAAKVVRHIMAGRCLLGNAARNSLKNDAWMLVVSVLCAVSWKHCGGTHRRQAIRAQEVP